MLNNQVFPKVRRRTIRAVVVIPGLGAGGAERSFVTLAKHFQSVEIEAIVVRKGGTASPDLIAEARSYSKVVLCESDEQFAAEIAIRCRKTNVVLTWGVADLARLRADIDVPFIDICHTSAEWKSLTPVMAATAEGANYLVAVSEAARQSYPEQYRDRVRVIHNGIEASRCSPRMGRDHVRRSWGLTHHKVALYVGRFSDEKRPISLVDTLPDDWMLIAAGPDNEKKQEFATAATSRASGRTAFVPFSTHVGDLMAAADALIMPSLTEAHPLTMFEAFFARLPVVCCEFAFLDEKIPDDPRHWRDLVWPMSIEFSRLDLKSRLAEVGRSKRVEDAHDIVCRSFLADQMAARYESFIGEVLREWFSYAINPPLIYNGMGPVKRGMEQK